MLLAIGHWCLVIDHWLLVIGYWSRRMDGRTDGQTDRRTDGPTDGRVDSAGIQAHAKRTIKTLSHEEHLDLARDALNHVLWLIHFVTNIPQDEIMAIMQDTSGRSWLTNRIGQTDADE